MIQSLKEKRSRRIFLYFAIFVIVHMVYLGFWGTQKINYHVDEIFTYGLANDKGAMMPVYPEWESQVPYSGASFLQESLSVDSEQRFDYSIVWENQKNDVHPPLYYVLVHTVCSLLPGVFSKWQGLVINFLMLLFVDILVYFAGRQLFKSRETAFVAAVINALTLLSVNMALYLRMYSMMTVFTVGVTTLFLYYARRQLDLKFYILLFLGSVGGALTQYYFLIYLFFICLVFGILLLLQKKWKETIGYMLTLSAAGGASILIFPAMVGQIFGGSDRGAEAFENAKHLSDIAFRLKSYYEILNNEVFGGCAPLFLLFAGILLLVALVKKERTLYGVFEICLMLLPTVGYFIIVAVISPYMENRYIMGSGPICVLAAVWILYSLINVTGHKIPVKRINTVIVIVFSILICLEMNQTDWKPVYTYQNMKQKQDIAEQYQNEKVLYLFDNIWTVNDNLMELEKYQEFTFVHPNHFAEYVRSVGEDTLIFYNESSISDEEAIQTLLSTEQNLEGYELLYQNSAESIFYLY